MAVPEIIEPASLGDYLEVMSRAVFQAGVSWKMIENKWPAYRELFENFDAPVVAAFGEGDIDRIASDARIVRTRKKIAATVENARQMVALEREHGALRDYLRSFDSYGALSKDLKARFAFLGELSAYYFLFRVGERVPRFEEWEQTIPGDHPRMREMVALARERGYDV